jgi:hypothetical protein
MSVHRGEADVAARLRSADAGLQCDEVDLGAGRAGRVERELIAGDRQHARRHRDDLIATSGE